jgi:hypothetical protein
MRDSTVAHLGNFQTNGVNRRTKMPYEYKMMQVPPAIQVKAKDQRGNEAAAYLQEIATSQTKEGWEFYRVDTIGVVVQPGCLGALLGAQRTMTEYYVVTFRRPLNA